MNIFANWILGIAGVAVLGVLADSALPEGETSKHVRAVFALVTTLAILMPVPRLLNAEISFDFFSADAPQAMLDMTDRQLEVDLTIALAATGIAGAEVRIFGLGARYITVSAPGAGDEGKIRETVANITGIEPGRIYVYV
ncbi:MAG: hypothetical protein FWE62_00595 [Firmicutes bacterium]|nr:hypothetical protein [Bacillota bacterium]